ncbi:MAG: lipoprotein insertase outer membrane protein LolB [Pseudohongiellaceae bacterium]
MLLVGCTNRPLISGDVRPGDQTWSLAGKLGVLAGDTRGTFTIDWQQHREQFEINLLGLFGLGHVRVNGNLEGVMLNVRGQEPVYADSPDALLLATTGLDIPVTPLRYWVRGKPAPGRYKKHERGFSQMGWRVEYLSCDQGLPVRLRVTRPQVRLTMVVHQWTN